MANAKKLVEQITKASAEAVASVPDLVQCGKCGATCSPALLDVRTARIAPGVKQASLHCAQCGTLLARTIDGIAVPVGLGCKAGTPEDEIPATAKGEDPRLRPGIETDPDAIRARQMAEMVKEVADMKAKLAAVVPVVKAAEAPKTAPPV